MRICKWGNSLAIRLPAAVVTAMDLQAGDEISLSVAGTHSFHLEKQPGVDQLLARLRRMRGRLPADFKFDRLEAHAR